MRGRTLAVISLIVIIFAMASVMVSRTVSGTVFGIGTAGTAPAGARIRVEVLNATTTRGLARRATDVLRAKGFDVVEVGTSRERSDSTLVLDRSNHPDWARRVAAALGGAQVISRPDTSRYLDITVLIGASWRPPTQPFHP